MAEIIVRPARKSDTPKIAELMLAMWRLHLESEPDFISDGDWLSEPPENYLRGYFGEDENKFLLVATIDEAICGVARAYLKNLDGSFLRENRVLYIDDISVDEKYRRRGIATKLISEMEKLARENGVNWTMARVYNFNE
jgi:ribosomal protein S18 acetylase RimI-like enzyme